MEQKKKVAEKIESLLDDIFDWDLTQNDCGILFGEVEMPELLKKHYQNREKDDLEI